MKSLTQPSLSISLIAVLCFASITAAQTAQRPPSENTDLLLPTRERLADLVDQLNLDLQHFETAYELEYLKNLPANDPTPWGEVEPFRVASIEMLVSGGMMRAVVGDRDRPDQQQLEVWDAGKTTIRSVQRGNMNFAFSPDFQITGNMGRNESLRFNLIDDRFPTRAGTLADAIRQYPVVSQQVKDGVLTHRWIAGKSETFCQIETLVVRLAPEFEILSYDMLMADTPVLEQAERHLVMRVTMKYARWERRGAQRIPWLMYRDTLSARDRDDRENTMIKSRVVYRRINFDDRSQNPPPPDQFTLPLVYGAEVSDSQFRPTWNLWFRVGGRSLQAQSLRFDFDDPILIHPGDEFVQVVKRGHVYLPAEGERFGVNPPLQLVKSGGPGDSIRDRLHELQQERSVFDGNEHDPEELAEHARWLKNWHARGTELIGRLWDIEPDAPELPTLLPYRWKYADLLPDIHLARELRTFSRSHPAEEQAIAAGEYWLAAHGATSPEAAPHQREEAADAFIRSHPEDLRSARLLTLCWLATDDPITADRLKRRIVSSYPDSGEGRTFFSQIREAEAVGETVDFTFTDHLSGREISMTDLRGKVIVLNFWATWCGPCVASMPYYKEHYRKLKEKYGARFEMIGVNMDADPQTMLTFCREREIDWPQFCEEGKTWDTSVARTFGVSGIPRTIIVGSDGRVRNMRARALNFLVSEVSSVFQQEKRERLYDEGDDRGPGDRGGS